MKRRRVVIAGGGTGGHFYPALVLAQTLQKRGWEPLLAVRKGDPALALLEIQSIPSAELDLRGMPRSGSPLELLRAGASFGWKLAAGLDRARRLLRDFEPAAVVGMGGYLSFPVTAAAALRRIPRAVHESNAVLGLANQACVSLGARLFWGLPPPPGTPGKLTGTPIRPALWTALEPAAARRELDLSPDRRTLLVFGGSQGAKGVNQAVPRACARLWGKHPESFQVLHLAGARDAVTVRAAYGRGPALVLDYLERMELAYGAADLVLCRAGASTLAELAALKKPSVLVPYPFAAARHQDANALLLESRGAAVMAAEEGLGERLAGVLEDLLFSKESSSRRGAMAEAFSALGLPPAPRAAEELADAVETLAETRS